MSEQWFLVDDLTGMDAVTGSGIPTPLYVEPTPEAGQAVVRVCGGWPDKMYYVPGDKGFENIEQSPLITVGRFLTLFTLPEHIAIHTAAQTDMEITALLFMLQGFTAGLSLQEPLLAQLIGILVQKGLLTTDRVTQILSGQPPA